VTTKETPADLLSKFESTLAEIEPPEAPALIVRLAACQQALAARMAMNGHGASAAAAESGDADRLLTLDEAAAALKVEPAWLKRRASKLPFARKLSRKVIRFSEAGLRRWQARRA
jgi:hypothetical protein